MIRKLQQYLGISTDPDPLTAPKNTKVKNVEYADAQTLIVPKCRSCGMPSVSISLQSPIEGSFTTTASALSPEKNETTAVNRLTH